MKIVCIDNYDRDYISDILICENINESYGKMIVNFLNDYKPDYAPEYFVLKPDDYKLFIFEP